MKLLIGITGASGSIYALSLIEGLKKFAASSVECHLVFSKTGRQVWEYELKENKIEDLDLTVYDPDDLFAPPASGSAGFEAMIVCPCSMGTLAKIANGISDNLLTRAADVMLKERKKIVLVPREAPYSLIHIENMRKVTEAGGVIYPASPYFYNHPKNITDIIDTVSLRLINMLGIETSLNKWGTQ